MTRCTALRVQAEQGAPLSKADYDKVYRANVKDAGGKDAHKQRRAAIKAQARAREYAKTKLRAAIKAQKRARALAKTKLWRKQLQQRRGETEQDGRNMAAQVLAKLAEPGMKKKCLDSIASGDNDVQVCAHAVRSTSSNQQTGFGFFDMEGKCDKTGTRYGGL